MRDDGRRGPLGPEWARMGVADPSMAWWWSPSLPGFHLLLTCDSALGAAATASVGAGALAANRQASAMPAATIGADLGHALDVCRHLAAKVALDEDLFRGGHSIDDLAKPADLLFAEVFGPRIGADVGHLHELLSRGPPDP